MCYRSEQQQARVAARRASRSLPTREIMATTSQLRRTNGRTAVLAVILRSKTSAISISRRINSICRRISGICSTPLSNTHHFGANIIEFSHDQDFFAKFGDFVHPLGPGARTLRGVQVLHVLVPTNAKRPALFCSTPLVLLKKCRGGIAGDPLGAHPV